MRKSIRFSKWLGSPLSCHSEPQAKNLAHAMPPHCQPQILMSFSSPSSPASWRERPLHTIEPPTPSLQQGRQRFPLVPYSTRA